MKIKIFTVGGTIDKVYFDEKSKYEVGNPTITGILEEAGSSLDYEIESLLYKDSLEMTNEDRDMIYGKIKSDKSEKILITHGTDTMIDTAKKLKNISDKTIVITGSMAPAIFKHSDAPFNVGVAIGAVQSLPPGVYIAMNGNIFDPEKATKNYDEKRFENI